MGKPQPLSLKGLWIVYGSKVLPTTMPLDFKSQRHIYS